MIMRMRLAISAIGVAALFLAACSSVDEEVSPSTTVQAAAEGIAIGPSESASLRNQAGYEFPPAPPVPEGPLPELVQENFDILFGGLAAGIGADVSVITEIGEAGDARAAWLLSDLLGLISASEARNETIRAFQTLTGANLSDDPVSRRSIALSSADHLIAWDLPAHPGYAEWKGQLFLILDSRWEPFFADTEADIDWRLVRWGGVPLDDRPLGTPVGCVGGCIPALDDPAVTDASGGDWYPDDRLVFGVTVNGESRAYPKNIMEVHEMVNDTLGDRRLGIPYCTLCGSAQAYFTDSVPDGIEVPLLRTSGLLSRSNKVMFDLVTFSVLDTFNGTALSGPLREAGVVLEQTSVIVSTWADWKQAHPDTTIVAEDGGIGRAYALDPLRDRDADGPIFPVGDVDERLPTQEQVLGVFAADGTPIAFPVAAAREVLDAGGDVLLLGVNVVANGSGLQAFDADGVEVVSHQSFWFAWSQFNPETVVWSPPDNG
jgi:hypothetical protein